MCSCVRYGYICFIFLLFHILYHEGFPTKEGKRTIVWLQKRRLQNQVWWWLMIILLVFLFIYCYGKNNPLSFNPDVCSSFECKLPEESNPTNLISWVQCDSCDKWFHTICVGCDYDMVKSSFQQFRCGLCWDLRHKSYLLHFFGVFIFLISFLNKYSAYSAAFSVVRVLTFSSHLT